MIHNPSTASGKCKRCITDVCEFCAPASTASEGKCAHGYLGGRHCVRCELSSEPASGKEGRCACILRKAEIAGWVHDMCDDYLPCSDTDPACRRCRHAKACHATQPVSAPMVSISLDAAKRLRLLLKYGRVPTMQPQVDAFIELESAIASHPTPGDKV